MKHALPVTALLWVLGFGSSLADEVLLKGGGRIQGMVVNRDAVSVTLEVGPGRVTIPMSRVERIVDSRSDIETYIERASRLRAQDIDGWLALGKWAQDHELRGQAAEAFERVLQIAPNHQAAHQALGHVLLNGQWVSEDESYRARGYVKHEGRWITSAERDELLRQRATEEATARARMEMDARVREAEAQAREAEAKAREAEAKALRSESTTPSEGGIPVLPPGTIGPAVGWPGGQCPPSTVVPNCVATPPQVGPSPTPTPAPSPSPTPKPRATDRPRPIRDNKG